MRFDIVAALPLLATGVAALPKKGQLADIETFSNKIIYTPGDDFTDPGVLYARTALLNDSVLLATWENYSPEPPLVSFPIYRSEDNGQSWEEISRIEDQVNDWGLRYQPQLFELPSPIGDFPAGTILCAGNSIPTDLSQTQIDLYASTDGGYTWEFLSHVVAGGEALPENGLTPVWEPHMLVYKDQLVLYYADQKDPDHGQKMSHQVTSDLLTWEDPVDDVAYDEYTARPGMPSVTLLPNGEYLFAYEYGGGPVGDGGDGGYHFPIFYRLSADPLDFNSSEGLPVTADDGTTIPTSSPYVTWSPVGNAENGTIVLSANSHSDIFVNQALGAVDAWRRVPTEEDTSYTRHLRILSDPKYLLIIGAGQLPPSDSNTVHLGVMDLEQALLDL
ncbi:hypothetical protein FQN54_000038 [Arachnomyces sp. PD_36]|nr:hypothetical protein FQN54_000038 [Arachnomyces sp. PD_36]